MAKEIPPPLGCWRYLIALPVFLVFQRLYEPWAEFIVPHLPPGLSDRAAFEIQAFSFLFGMMATVLAIYWLLDRVFGTSLFHSGLFGLGPILPPGKRARLRRGGAVIALSVVCLDQAAKALYGVDVPSRLGQPADAVVIVNGLAYLMFAIFWWMSRTALTSLATSLILGSGLSFAANLALHRGAVAIPIHAFGYSFAFTPAEIAVAAGMAVYVVSRFWDPGDKEAQPDAESGSPHP